MLSSAATKCIFGMIPTNGPFALVSLLYHPEGCEWHSFARPEEVRVKHVDLDLRVLFDRQVLEGTATLSLERTRGREVVLDTRDLRILSRWNGSPRAALNASVLPSDGAILCAVLLRLPSH